MFAVNTLLLVVSGIAAALLLALNSLVKTLARREKIGFLDLLLTFLTTALLVLALVFNRLEPDAALPVAGDIVLVVAGALAVVGVLVLLLELRRPQRLRGSRGVLALWSGLLAALSVFTIPMLAQTLLVTPTPIAVVGRTAEETAAPPADVTETATPTPERTAEPTDTPSPRPTLTRTPRPTATATRERFRYNTPTPQPSATPANPCIGLVRYNLRLRAAPDHEAETLLTIPYDTTITVYGRSEGSDWWYVIYDNQTGWVDGEFIDVSSSCAGLPVQPTD